MTDPTPRTVRAAERLYRAALLAYPRPFRRAYGDAMARAFRDRCRAAAREGGVADLLRVCGAELRDLAATAAKEHRDEIRQPSSRYRRERAMRPAIDVDVRAQTISPRLWVALVATAAAFVVSLVASLNLYLLEDDNPLASAAYGVSPLLRVSYDGVYISALAAGVAVCAIVGSLVARADAPVLLGLVVVAPLVALGGFGGLLARHPATFVVLALAFAGLVLVSVLAGRAVAARARSRAGRRPAAILGACVSAGVALCANVAVLAPHTVALNPVSHPLYMRGMIGSTHLNSLLVAMGVELLAMAMCALSIGSALRGSV